MTRVRAHLKANAVGYVALAVAVIGIPTAWAALGKNTVGSKQLKKNAVTRVKIAGSAVNSTKVANGSLQAADFATGQLPAGPEGQRGPEGPPGPAGIPFRAIAWIETQGEPTIETTGIVPHGFSDVEKKATGIYCLTSNVVDPETDPQILTLEYNASHKRELLRGVGTAGREHAKTAPMRSRSTRRRPARPSTVPPS